MSDAGRTCPSCRRISKLFAVRAATRYEGCSKQLIWSLKFGRMRSAALALAELIAVRIPLPESVVIVPVAAVTSHVRRRGYDQSVLIARRLARRTGRPYTLALRRLNQAQQRGASRKVRLTQLQGSFYVPHPASVAGKHVMLVDDVVTTGATLEAAAATLKAAGARRISAVVIAQA